MPTMTAEAPPLTVLRLLQDWCAFNASTTPTATAYDQSRGCPVAPAYDGTFCQPQGRSFQAGYVDTEFGPGIACAPNNVNPPIVTPFHATEVPGITVLDYGARLARHGFLEDNIVVSAAVLVVRYARTTGVPVTELNVHRLLAVATVLSIKCHCDFFYGNDFYARIAGFDADEMGALEMHFLEELSFDVWVTHDDISAFTRLCLQCTEGHAPPSSPSAASPRTVSVSPPLFVRIARGARFDSAMMGFIAPSTQWPAQAAPAVLPAPQHTPQIWMPLVPTVRVVTPATSMASVDGSEVGSVSSLSCVDNGNIVIMQGLSPPHNPADAAPFSTSTRSGRRPSSTAVSSSSYPVTAHGLASVSTQPLLVPSAETPAPAFARSFSTVTVCGEVVTAASHFPTPPAVVDRSAGDHGHGAMCSMRPLNVRGGPGRRRSVAAGAATSAVRDAHRIGSQHAR